MTKPINATPQGQELRDADRSDRLRAKAAAHGIVLRRSPLVGFVIATPDGLLAHGHLSTLAQHLGRVLDQRKRGRQQPQQREARLDQSHPLVSPLKGLSMQLKAQPSHAIDALASIGMPSRSKYVQKGAYQERHAVENDPKAHAARQAVPVNNDPRRSAAQPTAAEVAEHQARTTAPTPFKPSKLTPAENVRPMREATTAVPRAGGFVNEDLFANNIRAQRAREQYIKDQIAIAIGNK